MPEQTYALPKKQTMLSRLLFLCAVLSFCSLVLACSETSQQDNESSTGPNPVKALPKQLQLLQHAKFMHAFNELSSLKLVISEFYRLNNACPDTIQDLQYYTDAIHAGKYYQRAEMGKECSVLVQLNSHTFAEGAHLEIYPLSLESPIRWGCKTNIPLKQNTVCATY